MDCDRAAVRRFRTHRQAKASGDGSSALPALIHTSLMDAQGEMQIGVQIVGTGCFDVPDGGVLAHLITSKKRWWCTYTGRAYNIGYFSEAAGGDQRHAEARWNHSKLVEWSVHELRSN